MSLPGWFRLDRPWVAVCLLVLGFACGGGSSSSSSATPAPSVGPTLTTTPSAQAGYAGDTVTFQVAASGTGNTYQWLLNGSPITGATSASYARLVLATDNQAHVSVRVTGSNAGITISPDAVLNLLYAYPAVAPGQDHALAITTKGVVYAWGVNGHGQLGQNDYLASMLPKVVPLPGPAVQVVAGWGHSLALLANGTVYAWGSNDYGQLGDNTTVTRTTPALVPGLSNIIAIASGYNHVFAYGQTGAAWIWGKNYYGQLGLGDTVDRHVPTAITVPALQDLAMGRDHTVMVTTTGTLLGCGDNSYGQLGIPWTSPSNSHSSLTSLIGSGVAMVRTFDYDTAIVDTAGKAFAAGINSYGALGNGTTGYTYQFVAMGSIGDTIIEAVTGSGHTLLLSRAGAVAATGYNWYGQLGLGYAIPNQITTPQTITGLAPAGLYAGWESSYAIMPDLTVKAWGYNSNGRLGDGTANHLYTPTTLTGFSLGPLPTSDKGVRVGAAHRFESRP